MARHSTQMKEVEPFAFHWRWHNEGLEVRRVWLSGWQGDQFEILDYAEFGQLERIAKRFSISITEAED